MSATFSLRQRLIARALTFAVLLGCFGGTGGFVMKAGAEETATSGYCGVTSENNGQNVQWSFDSSTGTLTISGSGKMADYIYTTSTTAPWVTYYNSIKMSRFRMKLFRE